MTRHLTLLLLTVLTLRSEIIPADRRVTWQGNVGIPGGIPIRTTVFTTLSGLDTTGTSDSTTAINNAIAACPSNQVVVLPAGFIRINNPIFMKEGVTLRGQGMTNTALRYFNIYGIRFNEDFSFEVDNVISSGFAQGSSNLTFNSAASYSVGMMGAIDQNNDPAFVNGSGVEGVTFGPAPGAVTGTRLWDRAAGHFTEVVAKVGNVLTVWPPIAYPQTSTFVPKFHVEVISGTRTHMRMAGVENLTLTNAAPGAFDDSNQNEGYGILMRRAAYCWIKNVETRRTHRRAITMRWGFRNQVEGCSFYNPAFVGSDRGYGVHLEYWSAFNLIQNNIANGMLNCVMFEYAANCNVAAYNFYTNGVYRSDGSDNSWMTAGFVGHAVHNGMNLFEGNVGDQGYTDFIHGSSGPTTFFRNHFRGQRSDKTANERCIQLHAWSRKGNIVGNVLGNNLWTSSNRYESAPGVPGVPDESGTPAIYWLGFRSVNDISNGSADFTVKSTLIRHGNWDAVTQSVNWETGIADHTLPTSYVYSSRPSYWGVNWPYPAIGSDLNPLIGTIPAQRRFLGMDEGGGPGQPPSTWTVSIRSLNPGTGVTIAASIDNNGLGDGTTIFTRTYNDGQSVNLTAPATHLGVAFTKWLRDGVDFTTSNSTSFTATGAFTFTAIYGTPLLPGPNLTLQGLTFLPP